MPSPAVDPVAPPHRRLLDLAALQRDARKSDWSNTNLRGGLICLPVITAWIFFGVVSRNHPGAVLAVAGAFTVGFGAFQRLAPRRLWPMAATLIGLALATWLGCVAGWAGWGYMAVVATICGFVFGAVTMLGYGAWWVGLQWMIALIVYGAHSADPAGATINALYVLAGGGSQLVFLALILPLTHRWFRQQIQPSLDVTGSLPAALRRNMQLSSPGGRHALRVALALALGTVVNHFSRLPNGYWVPMTAAILLKPDWHETTVRSLNRLLGTLAGAGVMTLIVAYLRPSPPLLGLLVMIAIWGSFTLQRVNYALFATCVTSYVVLLLTALHLPEPMVAGHRVLATLAGAGIALAVHAVPLSGRSSTLASI